MIILYYKMVIKYKCKFLLIQNKENIIHLIQLGTAILLFITFNKQCNMDNNSI